MILNILPYSAGHCHCHGNGSLVEPCLHGLLRCRWWLEGIVWSRVRLRFFFNISPTAAVLRLSCGTFFVVHKEQTAIVFRKNMICLTRTGVVDCVWGLSPVHAPISNPLNTETDALLLYYKRIVVFVDERCVSCTFPPLSTS